MVKERLGDNLYVLTDFVSGGKKNVFLGKDCCHRLKYLKTETPIVLPRILVKTEKEIFLPSLGGFIFSRKPGDSFIYFKNEDPALTKANELLEDICRLCDSLNNDE